MPLYSGKSNEASRNDKPPYYGTWNNLALIYNCIYYNMHYLKLCFAEIIYYSISGHYDQVITTLSANSLWSLEKLIH